jgi:hypothetical protein
MVTVLGRKDHAIWVGRAVREDIAISVNGDVPFILNASSLYVSDLDGRHQRLLRPTKKIRWKLFSPSGYGRKNKDFAPDNRHRWYS